MYNLLVGIYSRCNNTIFPQSSSPRTLAGGTHFGSAPADTELDYLVINQMPTGPTDVQTDNDEITEEVPIQFSVYADDSQECYRKLKAIEQSFINTAVTISAGSCVATFSGGYSVDPDPDREANGKEVWHGALILEFTIQRSLKST